MSGQSVAASSDTNNLQLSAVVNGYYQDGQQALAESSEGFGLGETEVSLGGNIDDAFYGKVTTVLAYHDGDTELELEEAFIQTLALPAGLSLRAGRFLSDIGYLNSQHLHTDDFSDRPLPYRAFLGDHYFDDGLRLAYVMPTDLYWTLGVEAFSGDKLRAADPEGHRDFSSVGVYTAFTKVGGDLGLESSWQLGLSYLRNENGRAGEHHEEHAEAEGEHAHGDEGHDHQAKYTAENTYIIDGVYKWAPQGNNKYQQLTLAAEYFYLTGLNEHAELGAADYFSGWYLSGHYQFSPQWSTGLRYSRVDVQESHDEHFDDIGYQEWDVNLAWHHSHFSTVRLQLTHQNNDMLGFDDNIVTLQYVMSLGAHNAHQF
ncbi:hypothetical protein KU855_11090 [Shewanella sp. NIFS-20-20]|nr:hypothetical protein [Shewanella sp. NIFS-20-20]MBV7316196.1 hypothetical protein [Shewanella sp. NIFS-20-20]